MEQITPDPKQFTVRKFRLKPLILISECFCSRCGHTRSYEERGVIAGTRIGVIFVNACFSSSLVAVFLLTWFFLDTILQFSACIRTGFLCGGLLSFDIVVSTYCF